jgi:biopolymer transport protein ExbB/TolQ
MRQKSRQFPFTAVGLVLIAMSLAPTVVGMVRGFQQLQRGEDATAARSAVAVAFHPALIALGAVGFALVFVGVLLAFRRRSGERVV